MTEEANSTVRGIKYSCKRKVDGIFVLPLRQQPVQPNDQPYTHNYQSMALLPLSFLNKSLSDQKIVKMALVVICWIAAEGIQMLQRLSESYWEDNINP